MSVSSTTHPSLSSHSHSPAQSKKFRGDGDIKTVAICKPLPKHPRISPAKVNVLGWLSKYGEYCRIKNNFAISPAPSLMIHCTATAPKMLPSADIPTDVRSAWLHRTDVMVAIVVSRAWRMWKDAYLIASWPRMIVDESTLTTHELCTDWG